MLRHHPAVLFFKEHMYIILGMLCVVIVGVVYVVMTNNNVQIAAGDYVIYAAGADNEDSAPYMGNADDAIAGEPVQTVIEVEPEIFFVHIVGEVNNPGVVQLPKGARVNDALQLAGGETDYADLTQVNLAAFVRDAMQIIIPAVGEEIDYVFVYEQTPVPARAESNIGGGNLININTATSAELQSISGIGPVLAQSIIDFRDSHGGFSHVEELINVSGIGAARMENLRAVVTVD